MLNELFRDGFIVTKLPTDEADRILEVIKGDTFVPDRPGSPDIAFWETDNPSQNQSVPEVYQAFVEALGRSEFTNHIRCHMGNWSRVNVMLQRGKAGDSMEWHHDSYDPMHMVCLAYFGEDGWCPEDGGQLEIGEGDVGEEGFLLDQSAVRVRASISPNHGTLVWMLNTNPRWVHRVTEIQCTKTRYTLIGQFGYRENVLRTRVSEKYGPTWR
mgnify:FL=1